MLQADPRSQDLVLFHEYFHGDNGRGVGASHQTGWSGLVALLLQPRMMKLSHVAPDAAPWPRRWPKTPHRPWRGSVSAAGRRLEHNAR